MAQQLTLYTCAGSRGQRATWAAEEAEVELDLKVLPFPPRHLAPEYLEINPLGHDPDADRWRGADDRKLRDCPLPCGEGRAR